MNGTMSEFEQFCLRKNMNPKKKLSIQIFENFVIDHGGNLDDVAWTDEENEMRREGEK
jgi:hypothetical protein